MKTQKNTEEKWKNTIAYRKLLKAYIGSESLYSFSCRTGISREVLGGLLGTYSPSCALYSSPEKLKRPFLKGGCSESLMENIKTACHDYGTDDDTELLKLINLRRANQRKYKQRRAAKNRNSKTGTKKSGIVAPPVKGPDSADIWKAAKAAHLDFSVLDCLTNLEALHQATAKEYNNLHKFMQQTDLKVSLADLKSLLEKRG
jgi:hypothetical protein